MTAPPFMTWIFFITFVVRAETSMFPRLWGAWNNNNNNDMWDIANVNFCDAHRQISATLVAQSSRTRRIMPFV